MPPGKRRILSGAYWVSWVKTYAPTSKEIKDLKGSFQTGVTEFKRALENATPKGAVVVVSHTYRSDQAAYLWHWAWKIANRKIQPKDAKPYAFAWPTRSGDRMGPRELNRQRQGRRGHGEGFQPNKGQQVRAVPDDAAPRPPAIDMTIKWTGTIHVRKKDGTWVPVTFGPVNANTKLHEVGASYGVKKLLDDAPHWSDNAT